MEDRLNQTYTPRVVRARINIPARPWQAYREEYRGQGFTVNNFKAMQKADQYFNGLEITLSSWWYDDHSCWHLFNWPQAVDDRVMCAMYHAEQYKGGPGMLPSAYKGDFEKFRADWAAGTYDPGATYTFKLENVEVLEVLQEEAWNEREPERPRRRNGRSGRRRAANAVGKKKHRPKSKAELLQAQWERERPRPQRPAAGWMQAAAERANRAQAAVIAKRKEGKPG